MRQGPRSCQVWPCTDSCTRSNVVASATQAPVLPARRALGVDDDAGVAATARVGVQNGVPSVGEQAQRQRVERQAVPGGALVGARLDGGLDQRRRRRSGQAQAAAPARPRQQAGAAEHAAELLEIAVADAEPEVDAAGAEAAVERDLADAGADAQRAQLPAAAARRQLGGCHQAPGLPRQVELEQAHQQIGVDQAETVGAPATLGVDRQPRRAGAIGAPAVDGDVQPLAAPARAHGQPRQDQRAELQALAVEPRVADQIDRAQRGVQTAGGGVRRAQLAHVGGGVDRDHVTDGHVGAQPRRAGDGDRGQPRQPRQIGRVQRRIGDEGLAPESHSRLQARAGDLGAQARRHRGALEVQPRRLGQVEDELAPRQLERVDDQVGALRADARPHGAARAQAVGERGGDLGTEAPRLPAQRQRRGGDAHVEQLRAIADADAGHLDVARAQGRRHRAAGAEQQRRVEAARLGFEAAVADPQPLAAGAPVQARAVRVAAERGGERQRAVELVDAVEVDADVAEALERRHRSHQRAVAVAGEVAVAVRRDVDAGAVAGEPRQHELARVAQPVAAHLEVDAPRRQSAPVGGGIEPGAGDARLPAHAGEGARHRGVDNDAAGGGAQPGARLQRRQRTAALGVQAPAPARAQRRVQARDLVAVAVDGDRHVFEGELGFSDGCAVRRDHQPAAQLDVRLQRVARVRDQPLHPDVDGGAAEARRSFDVEAAARPLDAMPLVAARRMVGAVEGEPEVIDLHQRRRLARRRRPRARRLGSLAERDQVEPIVAQVAQRQARAVDAEVAHVEAAVQERAPVDLRLQAVREDGFDAFGVVEARVDQHQPGPKVAVDSAHADVAGEARVEHRQRQAQDGASPGRGVQRRQQRQQQRRQRQQRPAEAAQAGQAHACATAAHQNGSPIERWNATG